MLVAAVIHVESKFNPVATSKKGALGLMQLMPATARELAAELGLEVVNDDELYEREMNIRLGFYYLAKLHREFNGHRIYALAAYNAGLGRARQWAGLYHGEDDDTIIERIPIKETRDFVRRVRSTHRRFKFVQRLKRTLGGE